MAFKRITAALLCAIVASVAFSGIADAQQGMTYEENKIKTAEYEKRTVDARRALAECKKIDAEITVLDKDVAVVNEEIYEVLGTDQAGIDGFLSELDRIEARLMGLLNLSDEALFDKRDEVNSMEDRTEEMKKDILAKLPDAQKKLRNIDQLLERINARMPRKRVKPLPYTVARGDNLWNIAGAVYKDPTKWHRIFRANQSQISDANRIFPSQVLDIPAN